MAVIALLAFMSPMIVATIWLTARRPERTHRQLIRPVPCDASTEASQQDRRPTFPGGGF